MREFASLPKTTAPDDWTNRAAAAEGKAQLVQLAVDLSPIPMWVTDDETQRFLAVNDAALQHYGYSRERFLGMTAAALAMPMAEQPASAGDEAEPGSRMRMPCYQRKEDGSLVVARLDIKPIDFDGRPAKLVAAIDLTEEHRALAEQTRRSRDLAASERSLRRNQQEFRQLFDTGSDWYWEHDEAGRIKILSSNFEDRSGLSIAKTLGKRLIDLPNAKVEGGSGPAAWAAITAWRPYHDLLYSHSLPNGKTIQVKASGVPTFDDDGRFVGYCGVSQDVTALIEAERALRESERQFRELFDISSDYYWESDAEGHATFLSPNYETLFGIHPSQMLGKRLTQSEGISIEPQMGIMILKAMQEKKPYRDFVYSRTHQNGPTKWFKLCGAPRIDADGVFQGYRGVGADITTSVEAEATAHLARRRLDAAVAYVTQPFAVFDANDRTLAYNEAFVIMTGGRNSDWADTSSAVIYETVTADVLADWQQNGVALLTVLESQIERRFFADGPDDPVIDCQTLFDHYRNENEQTYHLRDGRWLLVTYRRLPGDAKVVLWTDVTAIKQAEAEKRVLEAQLHHSQRLEALGTLAGGAAHEINNALVPVIALSKLVARKLPEGSRERHNLGAILAGAERSRDLVKQILDFSRKQEHRHESFDLAAVTQEALLLMRASLPASILVTQEFAPAPVLSGDPNQLHQVVVNLVANAAHAIGEAMGTIAVVLRPDEDGTHLRLSVSDTGCGMDEATKARIFEPFFTTKAVGEGTGLGLAVVHGIVKNHGGRIEVESAPERGTRFDVVLPLRQDSEAR